MKCFTKISLVVLSCLSLTKGVAAENNDNAVTNFFNDFFAKNEPSAVKVADVTANPTEIDDQYTPEDIRKYTKFLLNVISGDAPQPEVTTTTTAVAEPTTPASDLLGEIKDISAELDQIKERRVDEIDELIDIIKNVSTRLETLEDAVENLTKQEPADTVPDTKDVDLSNAEVDTDAPISPITETDLKYAAIFNALNKENEEKIAEMQENQIKLLEDIKGLLTNNNVAAVEPTVEPVVNVNDVDTKAVVDANVSSEVNAAPAPETNEETIKDKLNSEDQEFQGIYEDVIQNIEDYKNAVSQNVSADEQFTQAAVIRDKSKTIKQYINKLASLANTEDQKNKLKEVNDKYDSVENDHIELVNDDVVNDEAAAKESIEGAKNIVSIDHIKKIINNVAASTTNEEQVDEVRRIIKEIQLNDEAEVEIEASEESTENVDVDALIGDALFKVASNAVTEDQVEEVREFIKAIEAKKAVDDDRKQDEVVRKLIYDIAANTSNEEQVKQVQRIIEKVQLYNKFTEEELDQESKDNLAFGLKMAEEIQKSPDQITQDLKDLLVGLVNNAQTDEDAANIANIINQIKQHDELIKQAEAENESGDIKLPNVEAYEIELDNGTTNEVFLREDYEFLPPAQPVDTVEPVEPTEQVETTEQAEATESTENDEEAVPLLDLELDDTEEEGHGKSILVIGALGVIALAGAGYTYRSRARKMNDEFPFSDSNLPFSNSMNGLVVDKHFLFNRKNSLPKPEHIVNNDAVIRPAQPSWATSVLMDENNKKGLKENVQMTQDPEKLLDEQLREIENKEKVIVKSNVPSVVINIDNEGVSAKEAKETPKPKSKKVKKPKLRRSMGSLSLDKKVKEGREITEKKSKKHQKKEKNRKTKSMFVERKKEDVELDEELERSINNSFLLEVPPLLFDQEVEKEKNKTVLSNEKPAVPKRISSYITVDEKSDCPFTEEFTKEIMEDYNKKFVEMEKEN